MKNFSYFTTISGVKEQQIIEAIDFNDAANKIAELFPAQSDSFGGNFLSKDGKKKIYIYVYVNPAFVTNDCGVKLDVGTCYSGFYPNGNKRFGGSISGDDFNTIASRAHKYGRESKNHKDENLDIYITICPLHTIKGLENITKDRAIKEEKARIAEEKERELESELDDLMGNYSTEELITILKGHKAG